MILKIEDFLNEKTHYNFNFSGKDLHDHLKKFLGEDTREYEVSRKIVNFYNYSVNFLTNKYKGYDPLKDDQEGPADEEYINILKRILQKIKK